MFFDLLDFFLVMSVCSQISASESNVIITDRHDGQNYRNKAQVVTNIAILMNEGKSGCVHFTGNVNALINVTDCHKVLRAPIHCQCGFV